MAAAIPQSVLLYQPNPMIRLFLDTEWADTAASELVSLALVSEDGKHHFYAEIDPLPEHPTDFVLNVVYPLLDRGEVACSEPEFTSRLRKFIAAIHDPLILYDYPTDGQFLAYVLAGFEHRLGSPPKYRHSVITFSEVQTNIERYFAEHAEARACRHHAAVDAAALRWAFIMTVEGYVPSS